MSKRSIAAAAPALLLLAVSLAVGSVLGEMLLGGASLVAAHVSVVASLVAMLYAVIVIAPVIRLPRLVARLLVATAAIAVGYFLLTFYLATFASFMFFKELPTRQLISGYVKDLPSLIAALPITTSNLVAIAVLASSLAVCFGLVLAFCLNAGWEEVERWSARPIGAVAARAAVYGGGVHLLVGFAVPVDFHVANHEPIFSSWHDVRLANPVVARQRNPVETALDARAQDAYPRAAAIRTPNIILVYIDALRADVTQPYGATRPNMPFVTSLVESGYFKQIDVALAACPSTICGIGAILQSRPTWLQSPENFSLPKVLALQGYKNAYVLASNHQSFFDLKDYYRPIDFYLDGKDMSPSRHANDYLVLDALDRLGRWSGKPTFLMIGIISPHVGGIRSAENRRFLPDRFSMGEGSEEFATAYRNNYDNGVLQADDVLRQAFGKLSEYGYLKDAIVLVTADHGESLGERGLYGHLRSLYQTELRVPLWIHDPAATADRVAFARQIDVAPTILSALGLPVPSTWHGRSFYELDPVVWSEHYVPDFRDKIAIVRRDKSRMLKLMYDRSSGKVQIYDLVADPTESIDISSSVDQTLLKDLTERAKAALRGR